jgi:hypothetical protein
MQEKEPTEQTHERHLATGRRIVGRIRDDANGGDGYFYSGDDEDLLRSLYLTSRDTAIPEHLLSDDYLHDIHGDIRALYGQVFNGIRAELIENYGPSTIWVVVDPGIEDCTLSVLCTDQSLLLMHSSRAWQFFWRTEDEAAEELGRWYEGAAARLQAEKAAELRHEARDESLTMNAPTPCG